MKQVIDLPNKDPNRSEIFFFFFQISSAIFAVSTGIIQQMHNFYQISKNELNSMRKMHLEKIEKKKKKKNREPDFYHLKQY